MNQANGKDSTAPLPEGGYGHNVVRFEEDHPGVKVSAGPGGTGFCARRRDGSGSRYCAATLDELHEAVPPGAAAGPPGRM